MSDVLAIFGALTLFGLSYPGLLTAWWLLFPSTVERARLRLEVTPWRCFWLGGILTAVSTIPVVVLLALPFGPAKLAAWLLIFAVLAAASLGAAGLAAAMARRLEGQAGSRMTPAGAFVRSAIALELAVAFPVIGWLVVWPLSTVTVLGAAAFALVGWSPAARPAYTAEQAA